MSAPLIGMPFLSFLVLLILSAIAAAVLHWVFRYRLVSGIDGFLGQWMVAWLGAWLGPAVLGHWFDSFILWNIYILPALIGAFAGAFGGTLNAKLLADVAWQRGTSPQQDPLKGWGLIFGTREVGTAMADKSVAQAKLKNRRLTSASCIQQAECAASDEPGPPRPVCTDPSTRESGVISGWKAKMQVTEPMPTTRRPRNHAARWYRLVSWLFARKAVREAVATRVHLNASPEMVWNHIMLYEEVPGQPPFLLRALLPHPVRTEGDKTRVGAMVRCAYREGRLVKRIASVEPPHFLQFEVIEQRLGIEGCALTLGGSYQIYPCEDAADVLLTTNYRAYLRPRFLWRPLEALLVGQLHNHILDGIRRAILLTNRGVLAAGAESLTPQCASPGGLAWIVSQSRSRR